ncbi:MAG TPA: alcohol dehydrogenase catalytic domain-containing protein [Dehalococcoidia bacterium]|nr:alcohol dehydrogenase catalytic domain-containing protein [Dehalococcoidia bacterium]
MPTMLAAFCTGKHAIEVREADVPAPGPGEVLVRVRVCGICGSDLHFYNGAFPAMASVSPGHEFCGEIEAIGEGVSGWAPGDRVIVEPLRSCRECAYCRTGQYQICPKHVLLGTFVPGGLAQYASVPAYTLYALPETLDFELGALTEPLAVAVHGLHIVGLSMGERVLVMGSGAIGLLSVLAAKAAGAAEIIATYRHDHQGEAALAAGAGHTVKDTEIAGLEKHGFDVVVETVGGTAETLSQALGIVRPGGRISVLGLFTQAVQLNALALMLKEVTMAGGITYCRPGQRSDFDAALSVLQSHPERARAIITHRFPIAEASQAFATAADKSTGALKVHVHP